MAFDLMKQSAKLAKRLDAIPAEILVYVRPALVQAADDLARLAQALVPEDEGDLKASIAVTAPGGTTPAYSTGGSRIAGANQALVTVGNPQARHGHLVEFGTDPHINGGQFAGSQHPGTDAQPFLLPAKRLTDDRNRRRIGRAVAQAIRKAGVGGGNA
jgi:Bacteriophage HK97-gp10, putative tail-component